MKSENLNVKDEPGRFTHALDGILCFIFFTSLICSFRAINSVSIGLLLLSALLQDRNSWRSLLQPRLPVLFLAGCTALFLLDVLSLLYSHHPNEGWSSIRTRSALLFVPVATLLQVYSRRLSRHGMLWIFCGVVALASAYCLAMAIVHFHSSGDTSFFFYHQLVSPFRQNAVYFSVLVFVALIFLVEAIGKRNAYLPEYLAVPIVLFLSGMLFLLSSKLVIIFYACYLCYILAVHLRKKANRPIIIAGCCLVLLAVALLLAVPNPVSRRFYEIATGDLQVVRKDTFNKRDYFNGLQFRLLQWRFVGAILSENNSWGTGVGVADGQACLDKQYIDRNMYTGDAASGSRGYLVYNTHNQFLETTLQTGLPGLLVLLLTCFAMVRIAWQRKDRTFSFIVLLLLSWLFSESVFETQYGIVIFCFFGLYMGDVTPRRNDLWRSRKRYTSRQTNKGTLNTGNSWRRCAVA